MESYYKYQDLLLKPYTSFIYELEIYRSTSDSWNLEESSYYSSPKVISDLINFTKYIYKDYFLFKYVTLVAAPSKWLKENAIQITVETAKEKRKRKKDEKLKESKSS